MFVVPHSLGTTRSFVPASVEIPCNPEPSGVEGRDDKNALPFAMQKVEGSSPFIRFEKRPAQRGFFVLADI